LNVTIQTWNRSIRCAGASISLVVFLVGIASVLPAQNRTSGVPEDIPAERLLDLSDESMFPENFVATYRMTTERPRRRDTEMVFESSHLEGSGTYMEVSEPARSRGMRFLQKENDLWMYNPRSGSRRALRLAPRDSFQGSVFSNNDVSDPNYNDDYDARRLDDAVLDHPDLGSVTCTRIEGVAAHDEAPYGRIVVWLRGVPGGGVAPLRIDYFSRSGLEFKRMVLSDFGQRAGAYRPGVMRMESMEETGAVTTVVIEELEARDTFPARLFSQAELTR